MVIATGVKIVPNNAFWFMLRAKKVKKFIGKRGENINKRKRAKNAKNVINKV